MLLVIVGAGASWDSVPGAEPGDRYRPPLAKDLFAEKPDYVELLNDFPHAAPIVSRVRMALGAGASLESVLEEIRGESNANPVKRGQLLGVQFYLRALIAQSSDAWQTVHGGVTNYAALADVVEACRVRVDGSVIYVTFNYDTLLESGLRPIGIEFPDMESYLTAKSSVVKVHGSVNWGQIVTAPESAFPEFPTGGYIPPSLLCERIDQLVLGEYVVDDGDLFAKPLISGLSLGQERAIPAIAIPTQTKENFACPRKHIDALKSVLPSVRGVVAIGWRGAEEHFLKLLREGVPNQTQAFVVNESREACEATASKLQEAGSAPDFLWERGLTGLMLDDVAGSRTLRRFLEQKLSH